ncbi:acylneuraminate cytidylyltransferase family protein [Caldicoprobacter algeriensis]|uniref:acylneuraminate cytidylyltransferase family protein n=1 Tax=Caldicoprobacter algeriensis TaxID=699281 RepID=UPI00207A50A4|nr:acylneuraminate cytidylyltransferase family protein [Caldicoprobacter algeriensis]MCM8900481.1 acylneuraminate cytidylyltransferase family protein [Caldicoprobacter algeriensis]
MIDNKKIVAIIPARGGSKGIKRKNIRILNGKPLISYTIEQALKSKYIDRVIVSTEDLEIAEISKSFGAEVPFLRPQELAQDDTPGIEPIIHAVNYLNSEEKYSFEYVMCLQCTCPLRKVEDIDNSIEEINAKNADSLVSVCESEVNPYWMKVIEDGKLVDFIKTNIAYVRRQDLPKVYRLNGAIYLARAEIILNRKTWYTDNTIPYIMDRISSVDIDDEMDFRYVEFLMSYEEHGDINGRIVSK